MKKSSKYWLWGSICILAINLIVFLFKDYFDTIVLLWVVILTLAACLLLYPLFNFLDKKLKPLFFDVTRHQRDEIKREAIGVLERRDLLSTGDMAIITKGDQDGAHGMTNAMKIVEVGEVV